MIPGLELLNHCHLDMPQNNYNHFHNYFHTQLYQCDKVVSVVSVNSRVCRNVSIRYCIIELVTNYVDGHNQKFEITVPLYFYRYRNSCVTVPLCSTFLGTTTIYVTSCTFSYTQYPMDFTFGKNKGNIWLKSRKLVHPEGGLCIGFYESVFFLKRSRFSDHSRETRKMYTDSMPTPQYTWEIIFKHVPGAKRRIGSVNNHVSSKLYERINNVKCDILL